MQRRTFLLACAFAVTGNACATRENSSDSTSNARLIIRLKPGATEPSGKALMAEVAKQHRANVSYLRALGAEMHLYSVTGLADDAALKKLLQALRQRQELEFVELDARAKPAS